MRIAQERATGDEKPVALFFYMITKTLWTTALILLMSIAALAHRAHQLFD